MTTPLPTTTPSKPELLARIAEVVRRGSRFLLTSHARPDGDSIGSQVALALALRALGKHARMVNRDAPPAHYLAFEGVGDIEVAPSVDGEYDALFVMECGDLSRPGVAGLGRYEIVNIDHHLGNEEYGTVNWFDSSYAACTEMVIEVVDALGVALTPGIASALYLGIVTDTGGFRHAGISARTFEVCRRIAEAGVDPAEMARRVFDSNSLGKIRLMGALLDDMMLEADGRLAVLSVDSAMMARAGATVDDLDGLINIPLQVRQVEAVVMFKETPEGTYRASVRSKGAIDVREVAVHYGGGGHRNAAGFDAPGRDRQARAEVVARVAAALGAASPGGR